MIIVVAGPTGVGKTRLSVELAKRYNAEVINADSMQVYKELNIGTAKVTEKEKENVPHHLFDIKNPDELYTVYDYQKDLRNILDNNKNKNYIIVGGTGLYIKAGLYDYKFTVLNRKNQLKSMYTMTNNHCCITDKDYKDTYYTIDDTSTYNELIEFAKSLVD